MFPRTCLLKTLQTHPKTAELYLFHSYLQISQYIQKQKPKRNRIGNGIKFTMILINFIVAVPILVKLNPR